MFTKTAQSYLSKFLGVLAIPMVMMLSVADTSNGTFEALPTDNLASTIGGKFESDIAAIKCYRCKSEDYCKQGVSCTKAGTLYYYLIGTNITQKFCQDMVAAGILGSGKTGCVTKDLKDCVKIKTCTDAACTNCGPLSAEQKATRCEFSGSNCKTVKKTTKDGSTTF